MACHEHVLSSSSSFGKAKACWRCEICRFSVIIGDFGFCEPGMTFYFDDSIYGTPAIGESYEECFSRIYPRLVRTECPASDEAKLAAKILLT